MQRVAIFPGSFDPFTRGHEAVVDEALRLFDRVIIAIGHNPLKRGLLSAESRKRLIEKVYADNSRVEVTLYTSLTGDEARRLGAKTMIRSVRNAAACATPQTSTTSARWTMPTATSSPSYAR